MTAQERSLPIAVQLYTVRELPGSFEDTLAQVAAAGFSAVETIGDHGCTSAEMQALLEKHRLPRHSLPCATGGTSGQYGRNHRF